jgi:hypothetical protein
MELAHRARRVQAVRIAVVVCGVDRSRDSHRERGK